MDALRDETDLGGDEGRFTISAAKLRLPHGRVAVEDRFRVSHPAPLQQNRVGFAATRARSMVARFSVLRKAAFSNASF